MALAAMLSPAGLIAQQPPSPVTITGVVLDGSSGAPVPGVFLTVGDDGPRALSDSAGAFRIANVAQGTHRVSVQRFGYFDQELTLTVATDPAPVAVHLDPDPLSLEGLLVTGSARVAPAGVVTNAVSGEPVPWAAIELTRDVVRAEGRAAADDRGVFRLPEVLTGTYLLRVERLGFVSQYLAVEVVAPPTPIDVRLEPDSALLAGVEHFQRELRTRRNATPFIVNAYDETRIRYSRAAGMREFLEHHAFLAFVPCASSGALECVIHRGDVVAPSIVIDELAAFGRLAQLDAYRIEQIHSVEVFRCRRTMSIRAYTYEFVERMGRRPRLMFPPCGLSP